MNPNKVRRDKLDKLEELPNVGKVMARNLRQIGISNPEQLHGRNAYEMYQMMCDKTRRGFDPCALDVLLSVEHFMKGGQALPWWSFTEERKRRM